jgi:nitronate monooxygenase
LAADHGALAHVRTAIADGDYRLAPVNAGLGVGDVVAVEPAAAVIARLCAEAWDALRR